MTSLEDKAETPETTVYSIEDAAETDAEFRIESLELEDAEDVGTDAFPQYGDWLPCDVSLGGLAADTTVYVECPRGLAAELVDADAEAGDDFVVRNVQKSPAGEWQVDVDVRGD